MLRANQRYRGAVDAALAVDPAPMKVPERRTWYDARYIDDFRARAAELATDTDRTALEVYRRPVFLWLDVGFAIFLSLGAALFWSILPAAAGRVPGIEDISLLGFALSIAYGFADVAEDLWLARLLGRTSATSRFEGIVACTLTRIKFATISLSLVAGLAFVVFSKTFGRPTTSG